MFVPLRTLLCPYCLSFVLSANSLHFLLFMHVRALMALKSGVPLSDLDVQTCVTFCLHVGTHTALMLLLQVCDKTSMYTYCLTFCMHIRAFTALNLSMPLLDLADHQISHPSYAR